MTDNSLILQVGKQKKPDILKQIESLTHKVRKEPQSEILKPTKLNLYGLDVRFKYTEELLKKEKEKRKLTNISKSKNPDKEYQKINRHALPQEVQDIVKPQIKIPIERRDSFTLLKRQIDKNLINTKTEAATPKNRNSEDDQNQNLSLDDTDEWINNYYQGLMLLNEKLENRMQLARQHGNTSLSAFNSPKKANQHPGSKMSSKYNSLRQPEDTFTFMMSQSGRHRDDYKDEGEKYIVELREHIKKKEAEILAQSKIKDLKQNQINIMTMAPAEKSEYLLRRKLQEKKEAETQRVPNVKSLILEENHAACTAFIKRNGQSSTSPKVLSLSKKPTSKEKDEILGQAKESQAYKQTFQWTFGQYRNMNRFFENEKLKDKLKERGSLYGVPSTEYSQEKEIQDLLLRMPPMITKPQGLFNNSEMEKKFLVFQEKTREILEEEEEELRILQETEPHTRRSNKFAESAATQYNQSQQSHKGKHSVNHSSLQGQSQLMDASDNNNSQIVVGGTQLNQSPGANVIKVHQNYQLTVGKPKKQLASSLDMKEKEYLKFCLQEEKTTYQDEVQSKYHDKFNWSIMMDPESTRQKNEIMRRIKLFQMKQRNMPNFIRKKREEILANRAQSNDYSIKQSEPLIPLSMTDKKPSQFSRRMVEEDTENKIRGDFVDYVKEVLTKTSAANQSIGGKKIKTQKLTQKNLTDEITTLLREGVVNKKQAVYNISIPDILRQQLRKEPS